MNSSTHRAQRYELSPAWYFMCLCMSFQEIKHLPHRAHWYEFFTGWHLTCFFMWWLNSKQLSHRAQCYVISLAWIFMCIVWWFLMLLLNISSTRNHLFLQKAFNRAKISWECWPPSACSIHQESSLSPNGVLNRVRMMLGIADLPVAIQSTRNHHFFTRALWTGPWSCCVLPMAPRSYSLLLASLLMFHPSGIISFSYNTS